MTLGGYIFLGLVLLVVAAIDAWIISSIFRSDHDVATKAGWSAAVILLPLIGWIAWGRFGPRGMVVPPSEGNPNADNTVPYTPSSSAQSGKVNESYRELP